jgi:hypothetical protein
VRIRLAAPPPELARDEPDAHLVLEDGTAHCSLWWASGAIGHFRARDAESGAGLLSAACARLAERGCVRAVGPMDGSTWRAYRLVTERGEEPPFFLEPDTPAHWGECFARAGFSVLARYCSSLQSDLAVDEVRLAGVAHRAAAAGIRMRHFDPHNAGRDLGAMHALAQGAFRHAFLFSPIAREKFVEQYARVLPLLRPELVQLAEQGDELVAFLFALPDALESAPRTVILKTVAARRGRAAAGLASLLAARAAAAARAMGFTRAIHALMHEANVSRNWSARSARVMRRYALMGRAL